MIAAAPRTLTDALNAAPATREFITAWNDEDDCETVTFGEFRRRARVQAALLRKHGAAAGDRIVIIMPQGIPAMTVFAGAMMLGAVPAFLAYPNFKVEPSKYRSGLGGVTANLSARLVVIDAQFPDEMLGHVALGKSTQLLRASNDVSGGEEKTLDPAIGPDRLAFLQHSAGTTGLQKGVALTHAVVLRQIEHLTQALHIDGSRDRVYSWLPLYHDMGLIACFMLPLACHVPVVMQSPLNWVMQPESMLQVITRYRCTLAWLPNFTFQFVPRRTPEERWSQYDLSSVRALINCSEPVRAASMDEFDRAFAPIGLKREALQSSYAMAENVFAVTQSGINGRTGPARVWADGARFRSEHIIAQVAEGTSGAISFMSSGQPLSGNEVRIVSDAGERLPQGSVGEIHIKSDSLFSGYYNRSDLTAQAMVDGWFCSGDLGFLLDDELYVVGRKNDLIIVGGENIYPQDIEEAAAAHAAIHDGRAVAMGLYNPDTGTEEVVLVAEVESEELLQNAEEVESDIRAFVVESAGVAVRSIFLKPPKWIVKSTAGKPARSSTREKLLREHPELQERVGRDG
ncbi:MAG TPA: AMP-binding protein [Terriglobales bacterium]|jgi:acyl-CoA synthetase (AMP-forming)/AMP-acid ligase II|nr:AMP-binding protein [Terriglobales bacterium]